MWHVYILRSLNFPEQEYIGVTTDLKRRLPEQAQRRQIRAHRQIQAVGTGLVLRFPRQVQSAGVREIPEIPFRTRLR